MSNMMRVAVLHDFGKPLVIEDVPVPEPRPDQILVKIATTGVCHTDLHAVKGDWPVKPTLPFIWDKLENINAIFARMEEGGIDGRIVLQLQ